MVGSGEMVVRDTMVGTGEVGRERGDGWGK